MGAGGGGQWWCRCVCVCVCDGLGAVVCVEGGEGEVGTVAWQTGGRQEGGVMPACSGYIGMCGGCGAKCQIRLLLPMPLC